jgi:ABC-type transporter Mla subunit MlaD
MTLANAFSAAWTDLKAVATKVASVLTNDGGAVQTAVTDASTVVAAVAPSLAPSVTVFDSLEVAVMGKVAAAASDIANATSLSALFGEVWPAIESLVATLENHPTVASVTAALGTAKS